LFIRIISIIRTFASQNVLSIMFNRRLLRIKVMQSLYAFFSNYAETSNAKVSEIKSAEKNLLLSIDKTYELYNYLLLLIGEIGETAVSLLEQRKRKLLPTQEDLNPSTKFIDNRIIKQLASNKKLERFCIDKKLTWKNDPDLIKKILLKIFNSNMYKDYLSSKSDNFNADQAFMIKMYNKHISQNSLLYHFLDEQSIFWATDFNLVNHMVFKTIKSFTEKSSNNASLLSQYKDKKEDVEFVLTLFRKTMLNRAEYNEWIGEKASNWETDRIASMDILLMEMALCEILEFPLIPVKVTLNEYIEISKQYSTPKSKNFINGILDKLLTDLKKENKIRKTGRGLLS